MGVRVAGSGRRPSDREAGDHLKRGVVFGGIDGI